MEVTRCLHMNGSDHGVTSYANNSIAQRAAITKSRPIVEQTIKTMRVPEQEQCLAIADLGCSFGVNTFLSVSNIIDAIVSWSRETGQSPVELQVFLNDLPSNDFNSVFMSLPGFYQTLSNGYVPCYVSGTPGSFHGRLFPYSSLHLVHSSYGLHWLSQVPGGIENNKGNICVGTTSPLNVCEAYMKQFQVDFSYFLGYRAKELKRGGVMILTIIGKNEDPTCRDSCHIFDLLSKSLLQLMKEGMVEEGDVDSFNIPIYFPSMTEVKEIVEREGSFNINLLNDFETNWDGSDNKAEENYAFDEQKTGQNVANIMRAITESLVASHFGEDVIEDLYATYAKHITDHLRREKTKYFNITMSMTKK